jgi:hypothetical protein
MEMIDDKYIHDNMDEIVIFMIKNMPEKAINASNWRRNMKKEGVSKNISYLGFALAYKNDKKINSYVDRFYDKEAILDEKIKNQKPIIDKLENHIKTARNIIRDLQDTIQERFEGERDDAIFDRDDITSKLKSQYGGFLL